MLLHKMIRQQSENLTGAEQLNPPRRQLLLQKIKRASVHSGGDADDELKMAKSLFNQAILENHFVLEIYIESPKQE